MLPEVEGAKMYEERIAHHLFLIAQRSEDLSRKMDKISKSLERIADALEKKDTGVLLEEEDG
jgi:hypothetical protein